MKRQLLAIALVVLFPLIAPLALLWRERRGLLLEWAECLRIAKGGQ